MKTFIGRMDTELFLLNLQKLILLSLTLPISTSITAKKLFSMNEAETRAELIDPKLKACGWGVVEGSKVLREYNITAGKIQTGGGRGKREIADYVLVYKGIKLAVVEAKSDDLEVGEGVMQAKKYADKTKIRNHLQHQRKSHLPNLYENRRRRFGNRFSKP
jgi:type I site-specific restriction endonuclease